MFFNHHVDPKLNTRGNKAIEPVEDFKYLSSWISDSTQWEKCGPQSCHEQQGSDYLEQLWSLSYSVWKWKVDHNQEAGVKCQRMLQQTGASQELVKKSVCKD